MLRYIEIDDLISRPSLTGNSVGEPIESLQNHHWAIFSGNMFVTGNALEHKTHRKLDQNIQGTKACVDEELGL
jgi:hypothetical protein